MTTRALIIAIEDYPQSTETSSVLPGTIANAEMFAVWLQQKHEVPPGSMVFASSGPSAFRTHGTTKTEIKKAILTLIHSGIDDTSQLFVFLTGHGVMKPSLNAEPQQDLLLCSDFENPAISGDACVCLSELSTLLSRCLGAGSHLYFVDCCRTVSPNFNPTGLGLHCESATSGVAGTFQLYSASTGTAATNNQFFTKIIVSAMDGNCDLEPDSNSVGTFWVTFRNVARATEQQLAIRNHGIGVQTLAEKSDCRIRSLQKANTTATILNPAGRKSPPVELLTAYDEAIFLGETNGQLPSFIEKAFIERHQCRWKCLIVFSIEDLTQAGRPGVSTRDLEEERRLAEEYLMDKAASIADQLELYRYHYPGTYGSLWTAGNGQRRVHVSPRILGVDIRMSPSTDFIDFPNERHPWAEMYFALARSTMNHPGTRKVFACCDPTRTVEK